VLVLAAGLAASIAGLILAPHHRPAPRMARITEDDPRWDCDTMGNRVCGPRWNCRTMGDRICSPPPGLCQIELNPTQPQGTEVICTP
jgi:hypothetical protein